MRIAVLVIAICLVMIIGVQSCSVMVGGYFSHDQATSGGGEIGILIAFLFLLGAAFAMGVPRVSVVVFVLGGVLGISTGSTTQFHDLTIWGVISLILAAWQNTVAAR